MMQTYSSRSPLLIGLLVALVIFTIIVAVPLPPGALLRALEVSGILLILTVPVGIYVFIYVKAQEGLKRSRRVAPDGKGRLPVPEEILAEVAPAALRDSHETERVWGAHQPGQSPHTVSYAPRLSRSRAELAGETTAAAEPAPGGLEGLPGYLTLTQALTRFPVPAGQVLLGLAPGGHAISLPPHKTIHSLFIGPTDGGKTTAAQLELAQKVRFGSRLLVIDYKFSRPQWSPFLPYFLADPVTIRTGLPHARALLTALLEELEARLTVFEEHGDAGLEAYQPIDLWMDEAHAFLNDTACADALVKVLRVGRSLRICANLGNQDGLVGASKVDSGARSNLVTTYVVGMTPAVHQFLGKGHGFDLSAVGNGVAILKAHQSAASYVRLPHATPDDLATYLAEVPLTTGKVMATVSRGQTRPGLLLEGPSALHVPGFSAPSALLDEAPDLAALPPGSEGPKVAEMPTQWDLKALPSRPDLAWWSLDATIARLENAGLAEVAETAKSERTAGAALHEVVAGIVGELAERRVGKMRICELLAGVSGGSDYQSAKAVRDWALTTDAL